ncbi:MAG: biotin--[acetyl-CoA-carboxylase] ligase [Desulfurivibrionaceae bacterium]|nr:biotin--[acetyl-CoA-carboxylase] ligase [Desulfobulbales bacterium]MDT8334610.1 biotin--[acetyl-CoA-carboxylase] ligase [Desulfurivibrionaceae bacterium]
MIIDEGWRMMIEQGVLAGFPVRYLERTGSTNQVAIDMTKNGAPTDTVVAAESQAGGRGRLGRSWHSPAGSNLYFSMILRPALPPEDLPKITLAAGLALCLAVEKVTDLSLMLKWPNDLLLDGRKLAGILAETVNIKGEPTAVVLGVGLNVNAGAAAFPADLRERATSLLIVTGHEYRRSELLAAIVSELKRQLRRFERSGFNGILAEWRKRDATLGRELTWLTRNGGIVRGVSLGPDDSGQLLIKDADGKIHEVLSGDISLGPVHE